MDYEASPERTNLEVNVVHLSLDYFVVPEEDMAHLQFGPRCWVLGFFTTQ